MFNFKLFSGIFFAGLFRPEFLIAPIGLLLTFSARVFVKDTLKMRLLSFCFAVASVGYPAFVAYRKMRRTIDSAKEKVAMVKRGAMHVGDFVADTADSAIGGIKKGCDWLGKKASANKKEAPILPQGINEKVALPTSEGTLLVGDVGKEEKGAPYKKGDLLEAKTIKDGKMPIQGIETTAIKSVPDVGVAIKGISDTKEAPLREKGIKDANKPPKRAKTQKKVSKTPKVVVKLGNQKKSFSEELGIATASFLSGLQKIFLSPLTIIGGAFALYYFKNHRWMKLCMYTGACLYTVFGSIDFVEKCRKGFGLPEKNDPPLKKYKKLVWRPSVAALCCAALYMARDRWFFLHLASLFSALLIPAVWYKITNAKEVLEKEIIPTLHDISHLPCLLVQGIVTFVLTHPLEATVIGIIIFLFIWWFRRAYKGNADKSGGGGGGGGGNHSKGGGNNGTAEQKEGDINHPFVIAADHGVDLGVFDAISEEKIKFKQKGLRDPSEDEEPTTDLYILTLRAHHYGVPEKAVSRFVWATQLLEILVKKRRIPRSMLDVWMEAKGALLLPEERPQPGIDYRGNLLDEWRRKKEEKPLEEKKNKPVANIENSDPVEVSGPDTADKKDKVGNTEDGENKKEIIAPAPMGIDYSKPADDSTEIAEEEEEKEENIEEQPSPQRRGPQPRVYNGVRPKKLLTDDEMEDIEAERRQKIREEEAERKKKRECMREAKKDKIEEFDGEVDKVFESSLEARTKAVSLKEIHARILNNPPTRSQLLKDIEKIKDIEDDIRLFPDFFENQQAAAQCTARVKVLLEEAVAFTGEEEEPKEEKKIELDLVEDHIRSKQPPPAKKEPEKKQEKKKEKKPTETKESKGNIPVSTPTSSPSSSQGNDTKNTTTNDDVPSPTIDDKNKGGGGNDDDDDDDDEGGGGNDDDDDDDDEGGGGNSNSDNNNNNNNSTTTATTTNPSDTPTSGNTNFGKRVFTKWSYEFHDQINGQHLHFYNPRLKFSRGGKLSPSTANKKIPMLEKKSKFYYKNGDLKKVAGYADFGASKKNAFSKGGEKHHSIRTTQPKRSLRGRCYAFTGASCFCPFCIKTEKKLSTKQKMRELGEKIEKNTKKGKKVTKKSEKKSSKNSKKQKKSTKKNDARIKNLKRFLTEEGKEFAKSASKTLLLRFSAAALATIKEDAEELSEASTNEEMLEIFFKKTYKRTGGVAKATKQAFFDHIIQRGGELASNSNPFVSLITTTVSSIVAATNSCENGEDKTEAAGRAIWRSIAATGATALVYTFVPGGFLAAIGSMVASTVASNVTDNAITKIKELTV